MALSSDTFHSNLKGAGHAIAAFFHQERVHIGIKIAIAGMLALFFAIYLRLSFPAWSVLSVLVLMTSKYVGDLAEKALLRLLGTIAGGILGVWLVQNYQQNPVFFLVSTGALIGYCAYRFGGTYYPYGWYLCGFTIAVVSSISLFTPNAAWSIALIRIEEIFIGLLASLIVSSILWPQYARVDFQQLAQEQIRDIARLLTRLLIIDYIPSPEDKCLSYTIETRLATLRSHLQYGSRESIYFQARIDTYAAMVTCLTSLQQAGYELARQNTTIQSFRTQFSKELTLLFQALHDEFEELATLDITTAAKSTPHLKGALDRLDQTINSFREKKKALQYDVTLLAGFASYYLALRQIVTITNQLRELISNPNFVDPSLTRGTKLSITRSKIDPTWIRTGVKGGLAFSLALLFVNWMKPQNSFIIPVFTMLFTIQSRTTSGSSGDQGIFQTVLKASLIGIPIFLGYFLLCPALSHYALMNLFLFFYIAALGYWMAPQLPNISYAQQVATYMIVPLIALNPQQPVAIQSVINFYLSTFTGLFFSAIIRRTIFPILPQYEIRNCIRQFFDLFASMQQNSNERSSNLLFKLTILPNEIRSWIPGLKAPIFDKREIENLETFLSSLERLGHQIKCLDYTIPSNLPNEVQALAVRINNHFYTMSNQVAHTIHGAFKSGSRPTSSATIQFIEACNHFLNELRQHYLPFSTDNLTAFQFLAHYNRLNYTAQLSTECLDQLGQLNLKAYSRDSAL